MRLLHIINSLDPEGGGVPEAVRQMTLAHREQGIEAEVLSLDPPSAPWLQATLPFPVHAIGERASSYAYSPALVPWLRARGAEYDVVVAHGLWQYTTFGTWRALRKEGPPFAVFPHGMLDPWFRRAYPVKHFKKALYWKLCEHRVLRDAAAVIFTCEEECRLARETFRPYACREEVATLGIADPPEENGRPHAALAAACPELAGKRLFLFLGRLHDKKGCGELLTAFAAWRQSAAGAGAHLLMAGPCSDPAYLRQLQDQAHSLGIGGEVSFPGMFAGEVKWGAFHAAEVFLLPSHQENFGLAVAEALACGVPVLISRKVNIWREIIDDGAGIAESDDAAGAERLLNAWSALASEAQAGMRRAARGCFERRFEARVAADQLLEVFRRVAVHRTLVAGGAH